MVICLERAFCAKLRGNLGHIIAPVDLRPIWGREAQAAFELPGEMRMLSGVCNSHASHPVLTVLQRWLVCLRLGLMSGLLKRVVFLCGLSACERKQV
jgi:hypothetical protein